MNIQKKMLIACSILLVICLGLGVYLFSNKSNVTKKTEPSIITQSQAEDDTIQYPSYTVYKSDDIDFTFIIANIHIQQASSITLDDFKTSEDIVLSDVKTYVQQLESHSYYLGKANVWFSLDTTDKDFKGNIFIPVKQKDANTITITCKGSSHTFDLTKQYGNIQDLSYTGNQQIVSDQKTYQFVVNDGFEIASDEMLENGETMMLPSTARVFAYKMKVEHLQQPIEIERAMFMDEDGNTLQSEGSSISSMKYENAIGKQLQEGEEACFFFISLDPDHQSIQTQGTLRLTLQGSDTPIEVRVSLEG